MKTRLFIFLVAAQTLFLLSWAGWHEYIRDTGQVLLLETQPVDPHDIVRGDYITLGYKIGSVPITSPQPKMPDARDYTSLAAQTDVWVLLKPSGQFYVVDSGSFTEPTIVPTGEVLVRGQWDDRGHINYGIEQYFVPEGNGTPGFGRKVTVEVAVSPDHHLNIKRVFVDGKPYP